VPFGPSARRSCEVEDRDSAPAADAQAFWTEDSAAIHQTLEAPRPVARMDDRGYVGARLRAAARTFGGLHRVPAAAMALALVAVATVLVRGVSGGPQPTSPAVLGPTLLTQLFSPPAVQLRVRQLAAGSHARPRPTHRPHPRQSPPAVVVAQSASSGYRPPTSAATSAVTSVSTSSAASSTSSSTSYYQSQPVVATHSTPPPTHSSGAPAGASPASSQSTPAFGAAGALGPGSSPNS
jgi:hypothetical protein